jgi:hypothetical protein
MTKPIDKPEWFKCSGYVHVTNRIGDSQFAKIERKISNPEWVEEHAFFPLLKKTVKTRRYKKMWYSSEGKPFRNHFNATKGESNAKNRPIEYATHIDSLIFSYYAKEILGPIYDQELKTNSTLNDSVTAYRKIPIEPDNKSCKSNIYFAAEVFEHIKQRGECVALAFDIESFFPNLDHKELKKAWAKLFNKTALDDDHFSVFKAATRYSYIDVDDLRIRKVKKHQQKVGFDEQKLANLRTQNIHAFFKSPKEMREAIKSGEIPLHVNKKNKGIPHGLPISALLANLYMLAFDKSIVENIVQPFNSFYRRYSDDIIIVCNKKDYLYIKNFVQSEIQKSKLSISEDKTEVCFFTYKNEKLTVEREIKTIEGKTILKHNMPLVYLGFEFYGDKTLIKSANLSKFYRRMKKAIKAKTNFAKRSMHNQGRDENDWILFERKLRRIYTHLGAKSRKWTTTKTIYKLNKIEQRYKPKRISKQNGKPIFKEYRGNTLTYAYRAAETMKEPAIRKQMKRHFEIYSSYVEAMRLKYGNPNHQNSPQPHS